jgi:hypothetical protein
MSGKMLAVETMARMVAIHASQMGIAKTTNSIL